MKKIVLIAIATLISLSMYAQDISGKWNGVLKVQGTDLGLSINISKTGDELSATMDVPKQGAKGIPVTFISYENSTLKLEISDAGIKYEATLDKENAFVGTFKQGNESLPLVLTKENIGKENVPRPQEIDVNFAEIQGTGTDHEKTLKSIVIVRDISEQYATGGLYLMTHYGNLDELFQKENQKLIDHPWIDQTWRFCSIFSTSTENGVIIGRNWDNQNVGSIIVSHYKPDNGYGSVSFSRAIDMGFPMNVGLDDMAKTPFGEKMLVAPFYAYDGMNEHGLSALVTGINSVKVSPKQGKESLFIGYIVRKLLDHSKTVDEAIQLVENYIPFDLTLTEINCHFLVSDASGKSVILEYQDNEWKKSYPAKNWQVMTNNIINDVPDTQLRKKCWRYNTLSALLDKTNGNVNWNEGMQVLKDVSQDGTTWSVIYLPNSNELYFSVYQSWDKIYHIQGF